MKYIKKIINKNRNCCVKMFAYTIGKEEIAVELAKHYNTKIVVDKNRFMNMKTLDYHPDLFTLSSKEGFIHLSGGINSSKVRQKIQDGGLTRERHFHQSERLVQREDLLLQGARQVPGGLLVALELPRAGGLREHRAPGDPQPHCL